MDTCNGSFSQSNTQKRQKLKLTFSNLEKDTHFINEAFVLTSKAKNIMTNGSQEAIMSSTIGKKCNQKTGPKYFQAIIISHLT